MEFLGWKEEWKMAFNYNPVVTYLCVLIRTQGDSKKPWINKAIWGEKSLVATNQQKCCWGQGREENPKKKKNLLLAVYSVHSFSFSFVFLVSIQQRTAVMDRATNPQWLYIAKIRTMLTGKWHSRFKTCGNIKNVCLFWFLHFWEFQAYAFLLAWIWQST